MHKVLFLKVKSQIDTFWKRPFFILYQKYFFLKIKFCFYFVGIIIMKCLICFDIINESLLRIKGSNLTLFMLYLFFKKKRKMTKNFYNFYNLQLISIKK